MPLASPERQQYADALARAGRASVELAQWARDPTTTGFSEKENEQDDDDDDDYRTGADVHGEPPFSPGDPAT